MCGAEGTLGPSWCTSAPLSYRGAASSSPETSCEEPEASRVTVPPLIPPRPRTTNGTLPRPPSSITAPRSRRAASSGPTGRCAARASPVNSTLARASAATGGTKRSTVPALPTSTTAALPTLPGVTRQIPGSPPLSTAAALSSAPPSSSITAPSPRSAAAISRVSLARSGLVITVGPSASAARTSARLVIDFDPGGRTWTRTGPLAAGARQSGACPGSGSAARCMVPSVLAGLVGSQRRTRAALRDLAGPGRIPAARPGGRPGADFGREPDA